VLRLTFQVLGELPTKASRKQHRAIFTAFPLGDANLARLQIDIGGTQLNEFSIAHAREEQQFEHDGVRELARCPIAL
jgi:hypothetical protein